MIWRTLRAKILILLVSVLAAFVRQEPKSFTSCRTGMWANISEIWHPSLTVDQYHLYRTLSEEVDLAEQPRKKRPYDRLSYAKNLPPPGDTSNPDVVMDWLDQRGVVLAEWKKLRELLERASNLDVSAGKKEDIDLDV